MSPCGLLRKAECAGKGHDLGKGKQGGCQQQVQVVAHLNEGPSLNRVGGGGMKKIMRGDTVPCGVVVGGRR